jgi:hypothetical protein
MVASIMVASFMVELLLLLSGLIMIVSERDRPVLLVLTDCIYSQNVTHHVTISRSLYTRASFSIPQLSLLLSDTEAYVVFLILVYYVTH